MNAYAVTLIVQGSSESFGSLSKKILRAIADQTVLPLFSMPDLLAEQATIQLEPRRTGLHSNFTVAGESAQQAQQLLQAFCTVLRQQLEAGGSPFIDVAGIVIAEPLRMQLDLVLQDPVGFYGVYHTGAVYMLNGHEQLSELEDPFSLLFQAGGLTRLKPDEARRILNSRQCSPLWTRRGRRMRAAQGENWFARHA